MTVSLKYAHVERERGWLLATVPELSGMPMGITDQYLVGTRLRLREVTVGESVLRKLGHKVRLDATREKSRAPTSTSTTPSGRSSPGCRPRSCTSSAGASCATDDAWPSTCSTAGSPASSWPRSTGFGPDRGLRAGFDAVAEVTHEEAFTGAALAATSRTELVAAAAKFGVSLPD